MRNRSEIAIFCVLLVIIGTVSGETFTFTDSYDGTYVTGEITLNENGVINSGIIAGVTNGNVDVQQGSSQDGANVVVGQSGEIEGDSGFAGTLADDGNGNQGGNLLHSPGVGCPLARLPLPVPHLILRSVG